MGLDALGDYTEFSTVHSAGKLPQEGDHKGLLRVSHRSYQNDPTTLMFRQQFLEELHDTAFPAKTAREAAITGMSSWFPSFTLMSSRNDASDLQLGYLELNGMFMGSVNHQIGSIQTLNTTDALMSGPLALFSNQCVLVLSTSSSFMSSSSMLRTDLGNESEYGFGVMGSVTNIPLDHQLSVLLSSFPLIGPDGIRNAFTKWGEKLQRLYHTKRPSDTTLDYLQYSTDNGAYYYYHTEQNLTYQDTMIAIKDYVDSVKLPIQNWLMDSWWYYQGVKGGVTNWTARPDIFPDGISYVRNRTKWDVVAHNRYWSSDNVYAKQNGGIYDFIIEGDNALPREEAFWDQLFQDAKFSWGLTVYEQDWLNVQTQTMNITLETVDTARTWLLQMGSAAKRNDITIQYCMSWPRHMLQSLEIDSVTQARASDDYQPNNNINWIGIGISSLWSSALGVVPLKDNFWSSYVSQPHSIYGNVSETASRLHAIIASYSTGSVAPSDRMESLNTSLIMRSCTQDGRLLRPDMPAARTDTTILAEAGLPVTSQQQQQVWSTVSGLSGYSYTYLLSADSPAFTITEQDLYPSSKKIGGHIIWELDAPFMPTSLPYLVPNSSKADAHVYAIAPVFQNNWSFLGEAETKWTSVSQDRFSQLEVDSTHGFSVSLTGAPGETVQIVVRNPRNDFVRINCTVPISGTTRFFTQTMQCVSLKVKVQEEKAARLSRLEYG
eukprot:CAMPEP_0178927276 /NCGR_PEP_ID=MMETSP0786-20121207/19084_1 /TAXON_ID=186022 /ORGANISM="Thalassionema frauenfeldii, Strain CCMP 1798" /LENGTH=717 /DNA_ID=CAMNT_0020602663 /DNA_START=1642 /DNA_END=3795 /DNA_ORIENTATION=+